MTNSIIIVNDMANLAKLTLIGRLGADPQTATGKNEEYATISVAVKDGDNTTWYKVAVFGKTVDYVRNNLRKGDLVYVEARTSKVLVGEKTYDNNKAITVQLLSSKEKPQSDTPLF